MTEMGIENECGVGEDRQSEIAESVVSKRQRFAGKVLRPVCERAYKIDLPTQPEIELEVANNKEKPQTYSKHVLKFMIAISIIQGILYAIFNEYWLTVMIGYDPCRRHEIWRYFTTCLVHSSVEHLSGNVMLQLILAVILEIIHRCECIPIVYVASCVGGTLFENVYGKRDFAIGASGGSMGLLFSLLATILFKWKNMVYRKSQLFCVLLYIIRIIFQAVSDKSSTISHATHVGGAVTGFLVSTLVLKPYKKQSWQKTKQRVCAVILIIILLVIFVINITSRRYPPTEWNFNYMETFGKFVDEKNNVTGSEVSFPVFRFETTIQYS